MTGKPKDLHLYSQRQAFLVTPMRHDKIDIWMKFFRLCNHKTSAGTLTQYFYHQFLIYPEESGVFFREIESLLADESEDQERNHMIHQYIHFLSPIYDQFRPYDTKCQLDDLYLRYAHPEMYNQIQA